MLGFSLDSPRFCPNLPKIVYQITGVLYGKNRTFTKCPSFNCNIDGQPQSNDSYENLKQQFRSFQNPVSQDDACNTDNGVKC